MTTGIRNDYVKTRFSSIPAWLKLGAAGSAALVLARDAGLWRRDARFRTQYERFISRHLLCRTIVPVTRLVTETRHSTMETL
jgi:hypothetical protein